MSLTLITCHFFSYWISGFVFFLMQPKYTLSPNIYRDVTMPWGDFFQCIFVNQFFLTLPFLGITEYLWTNHAVLEWYDIVRFGQMMVIEEIIFYWIHRAILHSHYGYKYIHYRHHIYITPISLFKTIFFV